MSRITKVKQQVDALYQAKNPSRDDWADWLYEKHVFAVSDEAEILAARFGANKDLVMAAGMLHDIADAVMKRFDEKHESQSLVIAREILQKSGFSTEEIQLVVDDAIALHSCRDGKSPSSLEGRMMATADAVVHLKSDFYEIALGKMREEKRPLEKIRAWARKKIEKDFHDKILFEEIKEEVRTDYEKLKETILKV